MEEGSVCFLKLGRRNSGTHGVSGGVAWRFRCYGVEGGQIRVVESRGTMKPHRVRMWFGGEGDDEYRSRSMMWADNYWIFCDDSEH